MNTFFQHKRIHKYTWYRDSQGQRSLIDFCIVSADLFSTVSDVRVKRGAELSTDYHLVVCTLKALKPLKKRKTFAKKVAACKTWLANKSSLELRSQYSKARKAAATGVKLSKERAWKEFGERLDDDFKTANKVFWLTIRRLRGKRSRDALFIKDPSGVTLKDQDAILNRLGK